MVPVVSRAETQDVEDVGSFAAVFGFSLDAHVAAKSVQAVLDSTAVAAVDSERRCQL